MQAVQRGDISQEIMISTNSAQFKFEAPTPTIPAPMIEPTMVCVPEIGIPAYEDNIVKS